MTKTEEFIKHARAINEAVNILESVSYDWRQNKSEGMTQLKRDIFSYAKDLDVHLKNQLEIWNKSFDRDCEPFVFECTRNLSSECEIFTINTSQICETCARQESGCSELVVKKNWEECSEEQAISRANTLRLLN